MLMPTKSFDDIVQSFINTTDIQVLSLDCFDTLFWRQFHQPIDLFETLTPHIGLKERITGEEYARKRRLITHGNQEINLSDIYSEIFRFSPSNESLSIQEAIEHEIKAEIRYGLLFEPAVQLLRLAKQRDIRTIIVSDTYFSASQLQRLLRGVSLDIDTLIDEIYCSSEWGHGKTTGLWDKVLKQEAIEPHRLFHVGDNQQADCQAPCLHGIQGHVFQPSSPDVKSILGMRSIPAQLLNQGNGTPSLFHRWYAQQPHLSPSRPQQIGWLTLGPVLACFTAFIKHQVRKLGTERTKVAFLLRDGFMPQQAYQALSTDSNCCSLRISRFTSIASSFTCKQKITDYLVGALGSASIETIFKQLLLPVSVQADIRKKLQKSDQADLTQALIQALSHSRITTLIIDKSTALRRRLITHIQKETGITEQQKLLLVDLGYTGTTLKLLGQTLEDEMNIKITACYLIASGDRHQRHKVSSLINPERCNGDKTIACLLRYISVLEMLCCNNDGSTLDYSSTGEPILQKNKKNQTPETEQEIKQIQQEALFFVKQHAQDIEQWSLQLDMFATLSRSTAIDITRYIYFPTQSEIAFLTKLKFDVNLGSNTVLEIANTDAALAAMRRQGALVPLLDTSIHQRMSYAAELRYAGLEFSIALMASYRYGLSYPASPLINSYRHQPIDVLYVAQQKSHIHAINSVMTFDGYQSLTIPMAGEEMAILLGKSMSMIEILEFSAYSKTDTYEETRDKNEIQFIENKDYFLSDTEKHKENIWEFKKQGLIYIPNKKEMNEKIVTLVYRNIEKNNK